MSVCDPHGEWKLLATVLSVWGVACPRSRDRCIRVSTSERAKRVLVLLAVMPANRLAAAALAELLSRRQGLERLAEGLVRWAAPKP
jgi:hypothetical protein